MIIEEKIEKIAKTICKAEGLYLIEIKIRGDAKNSVFEIYADNEKGITLGQCQKISRQIQDELDMDDSFQQNYRLDVSSPGLDRALIYDWQFKKSVGQRLELILKSGERIIGALSAFNEQELEIQTDPKKPVQKLQRADIRQVNIKLQW